MNRRPSDADQVLAEQAASWLIELEDARPDDLPDFAAWLATSPRHIEEFLMAAALWNAFENMDPERRIAIDALIEASANNVRTLEVREAAPPTPPRSRRLWPAAAALALLALAALTVQSFLPDAGVYSTGMGEQRAFKLEDGSLVTLNTQSLVEVRFTPQTRTVRLLRGEALFTVERDPERPFKVIADDTVIQAIGTQFNVHRSAQGTTVSVVEGVVQIAPIEPRDRATAPGSAPSTAVERSAPVAKLTAGEQARVSLSGEIVTQVVPDVARIVAWRERRLVFRGEPLEQVAAEFNRYNAVQIRVEGEATRAKRLSGVFDADDPHALVLFLDHDDSLHVKTSGDAVVISGP